MTIISKVKNCNHDLNQITEISVFVEGNLDHQFYKYQIIFCFLVILLIIGNIFILILLRFK